MSKNKNFIHIKIKDSKYYLYSELLDLSECRISLEKYIIDINLVNLSEDKIMITSELRLPNLKIILINCNIEELLIRSDVESLTLDGNVKKVYIGAQGLVYYKVDLNTIKLEELYFDIVHIGELTVNTNSIKLLIECFMSDIVKITTNQKNLDILTSERDNQIKCNQKYNLKYFNIG